ncbi:hypothetical protein [Metallosphaera javensis (ex Sakai et al. 2022)]|uniref:hypothetical protein n=1 Tax=Metallosphaera javensis (ex Sakai et al. 2022) TaxID=2775498 RepID=UPI002589F3E6|nr:MAG: hypothetical protein MjAS7_2917 [Metallosphaera javensis (ex Sakai et al. 2022)]
MAGEINCWTHSAKSYDVFLSLLTYLFKARNYINNEQMERLRHILEAKVDGTSLLQVLLDVAKDPINFIVLGSFGNECPDNAPELYAEAFLAGKGASEDTIRCALKLLGSRNPNSRFIGASRLRQLSFTNSNSLRAWLPKIEESINTDEASWWIADTLKNMGKDYNLSEGTKEKILGILSLPSPQTNNSTQEGSRESFPSLDLKMKLVELLSLHEDNSIEEYFLKQFMEGDKLLAMRYFRLARKAPKIKERINVIGEMNSLLSDPRLREEALLLLLKSLDVDAELVKQNLESIVRSLNVKDEYVISAGMSYPLMRFISILAGKELFADIFERWLESNDLEKVLVGSKYLFGISELRPDKAPLELILSFARRDFDDKYVKSNLLSSLVVILATSKSLDEKRKDEIVRILKEKGLEYVAYFLPRLAQINPAVARELREEALKRLSNEGIRERIIDFFAYLNDEEVLSELKNYPRLQAYFLSKLLLANSETAIKYIDLVSNLLNKEESEIDAMDFMIGVAKFYPVLALKYYPQVLNKSRSGEFFRLLGMGLARHHIQEIEKVVNELKERSPSALSGLVWFVVYFTLKAS